MKKPRRPRKPSKVLYCFSSGRVLHEHGKAIRFMDVLKIILNEASKMMNIPKDKLNIDDCVIYRESLYWDLGGLSQKLVDDHFPEKYGSNVRAYKKKMTAYKKKLKQYNINLKVWEAWNLKQRQDKIVDQMKQLEKRLAEIQSEIDLVQEEVS